MTIDTFWTMIDRAAKAADGDREEFLEALRGELEELDAEEIVSFKTRLEECADAAYAWDLWGAAYIMRGGCSDDSFEYFRMWLVSRGRKVFEAAVADPESLANLALEDAEEETELEELMYLPVEVYEEKTDGGDLYEKMPDRTRPVEPRGEVWSEDGDDLERRFPRLWKKYMGG